MCSEKDSMLASKSMLERTRSFDLSESLKAYNNGVKKRHKNLEDAVAYCHAHGITYGEYQRREFYNDWPDD